MNSIAIIEAVNTTSLPFHGQHIITAMAAGVAYVAMKPIVENIGLDWASQFVKLKKQDEKFGCCDITIPSLGGLQRMLCMPLKKLNGWLFSINPAKVRNDIRDRLVRYQEECFTALHDYWTKGAAIRKPETTVDDRTPLRGIVNRIMGKYGMTYQAVYKLVHKEFGVKHIDELTTKQTSEAIEYLAGKVIEGEFIGREKSLPVPQISFPMAFFDQYRWMNGVDDRSLSAPWRYEPKMLEDGGDYPNPLGRLLGQLKANGLDVEAAIFQYSASRHALEVYRRKIESIGKLVH